MRARTLLHSKHGVNGKSNFLCIFLDLIHYFFHFIRSWNSDESTRENNNRCSIENSFNLGTSSRNRGTNTNHDISYNSSIENRRKTNYRNGFTSNNINGGSKINVNNGIKRRTNNNRGSKSNNENSRRGANNNLTSKNTI